MKKFLALALAAVALLAWFARTADDARRTPDPERAHELSAAATRAVRADVRPRGSCIARGRVLDAAADIEVVATTPDGEVFARTRSGADGTFLLTGLPAGASYVRANPAAPLVGTSVEIRGDSIAAHRIVLRVEEGHPLTVHVVGAPSRALELSFALDDGSGWERHGIAITGSARVEGVPGGALVATVRDGRGRSVHAAVRSPIVTLVWESENEATLHGHVTLNETPAANVQVTVRVGHSGDGLTATAQTGPDGSYRIEGLRTGTSFQLDFRSPALVLTRQFALSADETRTLDVALLPAKTKESGPADSRTVRGRVIDMSGEPVAHALLCARPRDEQHSGPPNYAAATNAQGEFRLDVRPGRVWTIEAQEGARRGFVHLPLLGDAPITVRLDGTGSISGVVMTDDDEPMEAIEVGLAGDGRVAKSDAQGRYHFDGLAAGRHTLFLGEGILDRAYSIRMCELQAGEHVREFTIRSGTQLVWQGRVVDTRGRPVGGVRVSAFAGINGSPIGDWGGSSQTNALGEFRMTGRGPGAYNIYVDGLALPPRPLPNKFDELVLPDATELIEGLVLDSDGQPVLNAHVNLVAYTPIDDRRHTTHMRRTISALHGHFRARYPAVAQRLGVTVALPSGRDYGNPTRPASEHAIWRLEPKPAASWVARVVDSAGSPVADVRVEIHTADHAYGGGWKLDESWFYASYKQRTAADGSVRFEGLAPGAPFRVRAAQHPDYAWSEPLTIRDAGRAVTIVIQRARSILGRVIGPAGEPIGGAKISTKLPNQDVRSDADGRFRIGSLTTDAVTLRVSTGHNRDQPYRSASFDLRAGDADVELRLERGYWIEGAFVYPDGTLLTQGDAMLFASEGTRVEPWERRWSTIDGEVESASLELRPRAAQANGTFRFGPFPAGSYTLGLRKAHRCILDAFLERPYSITVPGPPVRIRVFPRWKLKLHVDGLDAAKFVAHWMPDEVYLSDWSPFMREPTMDEVADIYDRVSAQLDGVTGRSGWLYVYSASSARYALARVERPTADPVQLVATDGAWIAGSAPGFKGWLEFRQGKLTRNVRVTDGRFRAGGFPSGRWTVHAADKSFVVQAGNEELELHFR